ncbi:hypothetical protein BV133_2040 [Blastochloris viridis]|uniref:Uncharacterized protein n=1 Tax=Blastochloris viridis TaxID=1079 RepID=A0A182D369_BLAVI|nr:hypothetical protein BV133_2040 [Blastochloris viridis]
MQGVVALPRRGAGCPQLCSGGWVIHWHRSRHDAETWTAIHQIRIIERLYEFRPIRPQFWTRISEKSF